MVPYREDGVGGKAQKLHPFTCFHKPTYSFLGSFTLGLKVNSRKAVYGIQSQRQLQECLKGPYLGMRYCGYLLAIIYTQSKPEAFPSILTRFFLHLLQSPQVAPAG